jgi:hypothetical protein
MTGRGVKVLRIVLAGAVLAVVAAGCGGASRPQRSADRGVPLSLAQGWAAQAAAIQAAAAGEDDCNALRLAKALRTQVVATEQKVPLRLRSPLVTGVNALAARITCTPPPVKKPSKPPKPPKPPDKHGKHDHHGHGPGGDGKDQ